MPGPAPKALLERARSFESELVELRRDLHRHPELGFEETRTAGVVARRLRELGFEVREGVGGTGVVGELWAGGAVGSTPETGGRAGGGRRTGRGPLIALRADMDALPIQERAEHDYASETPGLMHACGHDAHTAGLLGAARLLAEARERGELPAGGVRLLFQPSEEGTGPQGISGASAMLSDGALHEVQAIVGLHLGGHLPSGFLFLREGSVMAGSAEIVIEVRGRSAHAARPDEGIDAIAIAAQGLLAAQQAVARRVSPLDAGVVSFGTIEGGVANNVVADRVRITGTMRWFRDEVRQALEAAVRASFESARAWGAEVEVRIGSGYPPVVNDPGITRLVRESAERVVGPDRILPMERMMEAEDFGIFAREVPGCFFWIGAAPSDRPRRHHAPDFDIDESVLPLGAALMAGAALRFLKEEG